jgi:hypothetical protein
MKNYLLLNPDFIAFPIFYIKYIITGGLFRALFQLRTNQRKGERSRRGFVMKISLRTFAISIMYPYLVLASKFEMVNASKLDKIGFSDRHKQTP